MFDHKIRQKSLSCVLSVEEIHIFIHSFCIKYFKVIMTHSPYKNIFSPCEIQKRNLTDPVCTFFIFFYFFLFFRILGPIIAASIFIFKFAVYWKMQFISAGIVTGMNFGFKISP